MATAGLTQAQYNVLRILRGAETPLPTMEVAARMVTSTPGITRLIDRLAEAGLVVRVSCGEDRRRTLCTITEEGLAVLDRLAPAVTEDTEQVMGRLSADEITALLRLLAEVREGVRSPAAVPTS